MPKKGAAKATPAPHDTAPRLFLGARPWVHGVYAALIAALAIQMRHSVTGNVEGELGVRSADHTNQNRTGRLPHDMSPGGKACKFHEWTRPEGGAAYSIHPDCFTMPFLNVHKWQTPLSPQTCRRIAAAAEKADSWTGKSLLGVVTHDVGIDRLKLIPEDVDAVNTFVRDLSDFILKNFVPLWPEDGRAGGKKKPVPSDQAIRLKGSPFVIRYLASGEHDGLGKHKDNADVSFIVLLSDSSDFEGGGTSIDAIGNLSLQIGQALVFNGQLVHGANTLTKGRRYVLSGFTFFAKEWLDMKRRSTMATTVYHH